MVINNAGVVSGKHFVECSDASIQRTFDVNIMAHFWVKINMCRIFTFIKCFNFSFDKDFKSIYTINVRK